MQPTGSLANDDTNRFDIGWKSFGRPRRSCRGTRELILHNLPYIVAYRVTDGVEILAIVHAAQRWPTTID